MYPGTYLLSPVRRAWPLVGLALALTACPGPVEGEQGPPGPQGPPGDPGDQGVQGDAGDDGYTSLIDVVTLPRGDETCEFGGLRYDVGLDNGDGGGVARDGILQAGEVDSSNAVCNAPGTYAGLEPPSGPPGAYTFVSNGGDGGGGDTNSGYGGEGGGLAAFITYPTGGHIGAFTTGVADTDFTVPDFDYVNLGSNPLVVASSTSVTIKLILAGQEGTVGTGNYFQYRDDHDGTDEPTDFDMRLYEWTGGSAQQVTGIHVQAGGTLVFAGHYDYHQDFTPYWYWYRARVVVPNDVHNEGVITTSLFDHHRYQLHLWAQHFYGSPGSVIDLAGVAADGSIAVGGEGGALYLRTQRYANTDARNASTGCNNDFGGIYNHGTIDGRPGGGDATAKAGATVQLCAAGDIYNTGTILSSGRSGTYQGGQGGEIQMQSFYGGIYNSGALEVRGGDGGEYGGDGGEASLSGRPIFNSAAVTATGGSVGAAAACTGECRGGGGGSLWLIAGGGSVATSGAVDLRGGAATAAATGDQGYGGDGGEFAAFADSAYDSQFDIPLGPGDIAVSGDIDLSGGSGDYQGGDGGEATFFLYGGEDYVDGQDISLLGYTSATLDGGDAYQGGGGGVWVMVQRYFFGDRGGKRSAGVGMPGDGLSGACWNEVPVQANGGAGIGGTYNYGGDGGALGLSSGDDGPGPNSVAVNHGALVAHGGDADYSSGEGGKYFLLGASGVETTVTADLRAGQGGMSDGGADQYGGEGVVLFSQWGAVSASGSIDTRGTVGAEGGGGSSVQVYGQQVDVTADIDTSGMNGQVYGGGYGGTIDLRSAQGDTVVTGTLTSDGGTGSPAGVQGWIWVDGFPWQVGPPEN